MLAKYSYKPLTTFWNKALNQASNVRGYAVHSAALRIKQVSSKDTQLIKHLRKLETDLSWNPGQYDISYYLQSKQVRIFVLLEDGVPISYLSHFQANNNFGFLGSFVTEQTRRGKGFGKLFSM